MRGSLSHGQVIEALIANRLTNPKAMVAVADWAHAWAVQEVYGIDPDALNDDRLGRALDALAPRVDQVVGSIGAKAIDAFGIDVTRCHWDMTSISLYGAYDRVDDEYPAPAYGRPKDRRTDLKQIQAGIAVTADGAPSPSSAGPTTATPPRSPRSATPCVPYAPSPLPAASATPERPD